MSKGLIITKTYQSPCGELLLGSYGDKLCLCDWQDEQVRDNKRLTHGLNAEFMPGTSQVLEVATEQLDEYFAGKRENFSIPLLFVGTDFQKKVWHELLKIPFGRTSTYGKIAREIGMPSAVRAAANATGANAISIFVPCHRVIGSNGKLTGYAGGLEAKKHLIEHEGISLF